MSKENEQSNLDEVDTSLSFVKDKPRAMLVAFHEAPKDMTEELLVKAFVLVTRFSNAVDRRKRALRKAVDDMVKSDAGLQLKASMENAKKSFDGFTLLVENASFGKKRVVEEKAFALLAEKGIDKSRVMTTPEPPPPPKPSFSLEKFEALKKLDVISDAEFESCLEPALPSPTVTVEMPQVVDEVLVKMILGPSEVTSKARKGAKSLDEGRGRTKQQG